MLKVTASSNLLIRQRRLWYSGAVQLTWQGLLFSLGSVSVLTAILFFFNIAPYNVNMSFMLLTLMATVWFGLGSGVLTAILAFLAFDFFFIPPYFTFIIDALQGWTAVFLFLGTALFANQIAGRARLHSYQSQQHASEATALYELATAVITKIDQREMLLTILQQVSKALGTISCTLYLLDDNGKKELVEHAQVGLTDPDIAGLRHPDAAIAQTVYRQNVPAFFTSQKVNEVSDRLIQPGPVAYLPLTVGQQGLGVIVLVARAQNGVSEFSSEEKRLVQVFANHIALAVEHAYLIREAAEVATLRDSDRLKSAVLASVSHELRTPLTAIKTVTANLQTKDIKWSEAEQVAFLGIIEAETERLNRLVSNLLDLSRLEAGVFKPDFGWHYLPEIVENVVSRLRNSPLVCTHPIITSFTGDIPLTRLDYLQIDQVLTNLIENGAKYSPANSPLTVQVTVEAASALDANLLAEQATPIGNVAVVRILDEGSGVPESELERIFDKFYRVRPSSDGLRDEIPGTGIGLAITKGIIEAHGGRIWAKNRLYGGSIFTFTLPIVAIDEALDE